MKIKNEQFNYALSFVMWIFIMLIIRMAVNFEFVVIVFLGVIMTYFVSLKIFNEDKQQEDNN